MTTASLPPLALRDVARRGGAWAVAAGLLLVLALAAWVWHAGPLWLDHPDLSHGLFTPLLFVLLLHESRTRGSPRFVRGAQRPLLFSALSLGLALTLLVLGCLYAVALDWTHPLVTFILGNAVVLALLSALFIAAADGVRVVPLNWPALVALSLWLLSVPLPPGTYARLTLHLQLAVTDGVLTSLHWLGIPATKNGNVIDLARTSVGVEEACSGVRSLLSCVYAGLFFSASLVRRPLSRCWLLVLAAPLAILMNFLRSLLLTLLAHRGVEISGAWHDVTGFAILAVTAGLLGALAIVLARREGTRTPVSPPAVIAPHASARRGFVLLTAGLLLGLVCAGSFAAMTRPADGPGRAPDLAALLPPQAAGWDFVGQDNMYPYAAVLQTNHLAQRTYLRRTPNGVTQLTIYLAYWPPGEVPVSHVASHTPDICWPGAGWRLQPEADRRQRLVVAAERQLPAAEYRHFASASGPQYVWFWHIYGGRVIESPDALSPRDLLASVLRFGVRSRGEQLFVRVSCNQPWPEVQHDPLIRHVFTGLATHGL